MTPATLTRDQTEGMDDVSAFANALTEKELDAAIDAKCRLFTVEILRDGHPIAEERNVKAMTSLEAAQQVLSRTPGNYGFRPVAQ
ncbi:MAG: hypothetical protein EBR82_09715 [Caulobacteraceae bacterium]|nr:hypothetical protein [Caulobacteraceae bacterium]